MPALFLTIQDHALVGTEQENSLQKSGTASFLPKSLYLWAYFIIFLVLWDTKGMTNPKDSSFPFASVFLASTFVLLVVALFRKAKSSSVAHINIVGLFILAEMIFYLIGNFYGLHDVFAYTKETSQRFVTDILFYSSFVVFAAAFLLKKYQLLLYQILLGFAVLLSVAVIYCSTVAGIDTHLFLNMASDYFIQLKNPYTYNYPDIYNGEFTEVYGDKYYFNYWPMALYICAGFRFLFNDVRYAFVLTQLIFVFILIKNRKLLSLQQAIAIGCLWLLNLIVLYVNERSWIDALVAPFFLGALVLMKKQKYVWAAILIGFMASIKLYYVFALPFFGIYYLRERKIKEIFIMGLAFTATFIPYAIVSWNDLYNSTIVFINSTKIREDSLSLVSAIQRIYHVDMSFPGMLVMFLLIGIFMLLYWRGKNNILNLVKCINLSFFAIFLLSKQSFCNYFYFNMLCAFITFYLEAHFNYGEEKK